MGRRGFLVDFGRYPFPVFLQEGKELVPLISHLKALKQRG